MSVINIVYDTKEKKCDITMDGKKMSDVSSVSISKYEESSYISITKSKCNEDDKTCEVTTLYANENEKPVCEDKQVGELANKLLEVMGGRNENLR